jgi:hypothetical protein
VPDGIPVISAIFHEKEHMRLKLVPLNKMFAKNIGVE